MNSTGITFAISRWLNKHRSKDQVTGLEEGIAAAHQLLAEPCSPLMYDGSMGSGPGVGHHHHDCSQPPSYQPLPHHDRHQHYQRFQRHANSPGMELSVDTPQTPTSFSSVPSAAPSQNSLPSLVASHWPSPPMTHRGQVAQHSTFEIDPLWMSPPIPIPSRPALDRQSATKEWDSHDLSPGLVQQPLLEGYELMMDRVDHYYVFPDSARLDSAADES